MDPLPQQNMSDVSNIEITPPKLTKEEVRARGDDIYTLMNMAAMRESKHPQFDGQGYSMYNQSNEQADMSFLPPKKNKMDSRLVTGTTHEKDTTILSLITSFNFEVKVRAFNEDSVEEVELGEALTAMIRKSRELEDYDGKRALNYRNMLVQGTSFIREKYVESYVPKKIITHFDGADLDKTQWNESGSDVLYDGCVSDLIDGKKVFLKDIRQWDIKKQPEVHTVEYIPRAVAESIFGGMERWKNVPKKITPTAQATYLTLSSIYADWTFGLIDDDKIEVWEKFCPYTNSYQLYLNGIPMLAVGFPLTAVSPSGCIPLAKGDLDQMNLFAYSKSIPAKTKILQAVWDEVMRVMLIKFKQGAFVPSGNLSNKVLSENIFMPGRFTPDISAADLPPLMANPGVTSSDFQFFNLLKETMDSLSVSAALEGQQPSEGMTATQYLDQQKKQIMKLGASIDAFINWEKQMAHLRCMNIISNWTTPYDRKLNETKDGLVNLYRTITAEDTFDNGKSGTRIIKFTPNTGQMDSEDVYDQEQSMVKAKGTEVRYSYINPDLLKSVKFNFYYEIVPTDKNNDKLSQMVFMNNVMQAAQIFGLQSLNTDYIKKRFAQVMGEDFDKFFLQTPQGLPPAGAGAGQGTGMNQNMNPMANGVKMPQGNTLAPPNMQPVK